MTVVGGEGETGVARSGAIYRFVLDHPVLQLGAALLGGEGLFDPRNGEFTYRGATVIYEYATGQL